MQNDMTTAVPGNTPQIPCRALVSLLGWAMELHFMMDPEDLEIHSDDLYEAFILGDVSDERAKRSMGIVFNDHMQKLITAMRQLTHEETQSVNEYLLHVCNEQMQSQKA